MMKHGERIVDMLGEEVDRIEKELKVIITLEALLLINTCLYKNNNNSLSLFQNIYQVPEHFSLHNLM